MSDPGSAVPSWVQELLPPFFAARPALTEAIWAFFASLAHSSYIIIGMVVALAIGDGVTTVDGFFSWLPAHWFVPVAGYLIGGGTASSSAVHAHNKAVTALADQTGNGVH